MTSQSRQQTDIKEKLRVILSIRTCGGKGWEMKVGGSEMIKKLIGMTHAGSMPH